MGPKPNKNITAPQYDNGLKGLIDYVLEFSAGLFAGPVRVILSFLLGFRFILIFSDFSNEDNNGYAPKFTQYGGNSEICNVECIEMYAPLTVKQILKYDLYFMSLFGMVFLMFDWGVGKVCPDLAKPIDHFYRAPEPQQKSTKLPKRVKMSLLLLAKLLIRLGFMTVILYNEYYVFYFIKQLTYNMTNGRSWNMITPDFVCLAGKYIEDGTVEEYKDAHWIELKSKGDDGWTYGLDYGMGKNGHGLASYFNMFNAKIAPLDDQAIENYQNNFWYNLNFVDTEIDGQKINGYFPGAHRSLDCMNTGVGAFTLHRSRYFESTIFLNVTYLTIALISFLGVCLGVYEIYSTVLKIISPSQYKENFIIKNFSVSGSDSGSKDEKDEENGNCPPYEKQIRFSISDFKEIHQVFSSSNDFPSGRVMSPITESESLNCEDEVSSNPPNVMVNSCGQSQSQHSLGQVVKRNSSSFDREENRERQRSCYRPKFVINEQNERTGLITNCGSMKKSNGNVEDWA